MEGKGRAGTEVGLERERRPAVVLSKSGPEVTPQGMVEPGWPFRVVLSWEEETLLDAGCPRRDVIWVEGIAVRVVS